MMSVLLVTSLTLLVITVAARSHETGFDDTCHLAEYNSDEHMEETSFNNYETITKQVCVTSQECVTSQCCCTQTPVLYNDGHTDKPHCVFVCIRVMSVLCPRRHRKATRRCHKEQLTCDDKFWRRFGQAHPGRIVGECRTTSFPSRRTTVATTVLPAANATLADVPVIMEHTGVAVGIGVPIALMTALGILALLFFLHKRRKQLKSMNNSSSTYTDAHQQKSGNPRDHHNLTNPCYIYTTEGVISGSDITSRPPGGVNGRPDIIPDSSSGNTGLHHTYSEIKEHEYLEILPDDDNINTVAKDAKNTKIGPVTGDMYSLADSTR